MTDIIVQNDKELAMASPPAPNRSLVAALDEVGLDERSIAGELKYIIDNAVTSTPKGEIIEDFGTKLQAINTWHKMRKTAPDIAINIANVFPTGKDIL